jgi:zinc transport system substrate-binding protein
MVLAIIAVVLLAGCGGSGDEAGEGTRAVAAAFYPLAWAVERVGGDSVAVTNLTPPGAEPHDIELSARDVERIRDADLVVYVGEGFQPGVEEAAQDANGTTIDALEGLTLTPSTVGHEHEGETAEEHAEHDGREPDGLDPHVWLDPMRFARIVERLGGELGAEARAFGVAGDLRALDREFRSGLADCERREIVTSHAAFGYLAARYRLKQIPITGLEPEAEPSAQELERVVDEIREHGATTVFFETLVSPRLAETVARESGAETAVLNPIEGLTEDQLAAGEDYFSVMRDNLAALRTALGCR